MYATAALRHSSFSIIVWPASGTISHVTMPASFSNFSMNSGKVYFSHEVLSPVFLRTAASTSSSVASLPYADHDRHLKLRRLGKAALGDRHAERQG
jgi:hypothetical protein